MDRKTGLALSAAITLVVLAGLFAFGSRLGILDGAKASSASDIDQLGPTPVVTVEVPAPSEAAEVSRPATVEIVEVRPSSGSDGFDDVDEDDEREDEEDERDDDEGDDHDEDEDDD